MASDTNSARSELATSPHLVRAWTLTHRILAVNVLTLVLLALGVSTSTHSATG